MVALENVLAVVAGAVVFVLGAAGWPTNRGILAAALVAALVSGGTWLAWWRLVRPQPIDRILDVPALAAIPTTATPAPVIAEPDSPDAAAYRRALANLEASTTGQVLLVSSPSPGHGATTVSINLAAAATQAGRRVVLVDGDPGLEGPSRYMGTGPSPGLAELAAGAADLRAAARLWTVGDDARLPVIPAGTPPPDAGATTTNGHLGEHLEQLTDAADLVLIDTPPVLWDDAAEELSTHADGTVLVVADEAPDDGILTVAARLAAAGAPVVGYIVNHADTRPRFLRRPLVRAAKRALTAFAVIAVLFVGFTGTHLLGSWRGVERQTLDAEAARAILPLPQVSPDLEDTGQPGTDQAAAEAASNMTAVPAANEATQSFLLIGGDQAAGAADVILLLVLPVDGDPWMVSLPRDLYVPNRCTGGYTRINATIHGCKDINGPTLLALTVEDFTGIHVDHFAIFDFAGFEKVIDAVGGVQICVDHPVLDKRAELRLPAGCTNATGAQALAWVRSRHTLEKVNGHWRSLPGASDLLRNQHQQDVILELAKKLKAFQSPAELTRTVASLSDAFTLDDQLDLPAAISLAWQMRDVDLDTIHRLQVPVRLTRNKKGQSILVATAPFSQVLAEAFPDSAESPPPAGN